MVRPAVNVWPGRRVLVTGHTGFKGAWLTLWLRERGAHVDGYALDPPTSPNLFEVARVASAVSSDTRADIADLSRLKATFARTCPDVVFHLAAQALVGQGYRDPLKTFSTNVMGAVHVMEAIRERPSVRAAVLVTTDKVYERRERDHPYREGDPLGGRDPYSASKAAAEWVVASSRAGFFGGVDGHPAFVATARAGNVIGGADWARDRLVPDCLRAFARRQPALLRNPEAVRPWQHVLDALSGYLRLAERLLEPGAARFASAWNFGPEAGGEATVGSVAGCLARLWGTDAVVRQAPSTDHPPEAGLLRLDCTRSRLQLGWRPVWSLDEALARTVSWYRAWEQGVDMVGFSLDQIRAHEQAVTP